MLMAEISREAFLIYFIKLIHVRQASHCSHELEDFFVDRRHGHLKKYLRNVQCFLNFSKSWKKKMTRGESSFCCTN